MISKFHVSYIAGSRGDYLTAMLMTGFYDDTIKIKISDKGRLTIKDTRFSPYLKTVRYTEKENLRKMMNRIAKELAKYPKFDRSNMWGNCHWINQMSIIDSCEVKNLWISGDPLIVGFDSNDITEITNLFAQKASPHQKHQFYDSDRIKNFCQQNNLCLIHYKDIMNNFSNIAEQVSEHKKVNIVYNDRCKLLEDEYHRAHSLSP